MELKRAGSQPSAKGPAERATGAVARLLRERHVRAGCTFELAYASRRSDADRHRGLRMDSVRRRADRRDSGG